MNDWPHQGWHHADRELSARATKLLGRQCYVCPGYDSETREPMLMIADGHQRPVYVSLTSEIPAAVAELKADLSDIAPRVTPHED